VWAMPRAPPQLADAPRFLAGSARARSEPSPNPWPSSDRAISIRWSSAFRRLGSVASSVAPDCRRNPSCRQGSARSPSSECPPALARMFQRSQCRWPPFTPQFAATR
jgi:hypothetical protein